MGIRRKISRLNVPRVKKNVLPRPRLMTLFSEISDYSIIVVRAGAGYGKTTAMSNYAELSGLAVFWLTLTEEDRDPSRFIASFVAAFMPSSIARQELEGIVEAVTHSFTWESAAKRCAEQDGTHAAGAERFSTARRCPFHS